MNDMDMPLPEPYGRITTHTLRDQQFFYRWPEPPYLDNAKECIDVHTAEAVRAIVAAEVAKERERICAAIMAKHEAANGQHNLYHCLAVELFGDEAIRAAAPPQCTSAPSEPQ